VPELPDADGTAVAVALLSNVLNSSLVQAFNKIAQLKATVHNNGLGCVLILL
jgi:hypothetical protein